MQFSIIIGNPPYGSGGNDAIKFLNRSGDISSDVRYVLPLSLRKDSSLNKVRLDFVCILDNTLPDSTFPGSIRAVYQNWVNSISLRHKVNPICYHPDFQFLTLSEKRDPSKKKRANLFIGEAGAGPSGRVKTENFLHYWDGHHFLYVESDVVMEGLGSFFA